MRFVSFLSAFFCLTAGVTCSAYPVDYSGCRSIEDAIARETQEIADAPVTDKGELVQLYLSRGESYLLNEQYEKVIEDFQKARLHMSPSDEESIAMAAAFRIAFGEAIAYGNLGMQRNAQQAIQQLQLIASDVGCDDCIEQRPCPGTNLEEKDVEDSDEEILEPELSEEEMAGLERSMEAIADRVLNCELKIALTGVIKVFATKAIECCEARKFWRTCAASIAKKCEEWGNSQPSTVFAIQN